MGIGSETWGNIVPQAGLLNELPFEPALPFTQNNATELLRGLLCRKKTHSGYSAHLGTRRFVKTSMDHRRDSLEKQSHFLTATLSDRVAFPLPAPSLAPSSPAAKPGHLTFKPLAPAAISYSHLEPEPRSWPTSRTRIRDCFMDWTGEVLALHEVTLV